MRSTHIKFLPVCFSFNAIEGIVYFIIQCSSVFMERNLFQISELEKSFSLLYELVYFLYETRACQIGLLESPGEL